MPKIKATVKSSPKQARKINPYTRLTIQLSVTTTDIRYKFKAKLRNTLTAKSNSKRSIRGKG